MRSTPLPLIEQSTLDERHAAEDAIVNLDHLMVFPGGKGAGVRASDFVAAAPTTMPSASATPAAPPHPAAAAQHLKNAQCDDAAHGMLMEPV